MQEDLLPIHKFAERGYPEALNFMGRAFLYGRYVEKDKEKAKSYFKRIASQGYQAIDFDNYGLLLAFIGILHFEDDELEEATHWFIRAYDFLQNNLPFEIAEKLIQDHDLSFYLDSCLEWHKKKDASKN